MSDFVKTPKIDIQRSCGSYIILESGVVITTNKNESLTLQLSLTNEEGKLPFSFSIKFLFEDKDGEDRSYHTKSDRDNNSILITCINFNNPLGTGPISPINIATYLEKAIFLQFFIYEMGQGTSKKIEYCLYYQRGISEDDK